MSIRAAIAAAAARLAPGSETPRLDSELLMAHALGVERDALLLSALDGAAPESFAALVDRRAAAEPIAYIIGRRGFWTIELEVGPGVLVPRPDSETLIEAALARFGRQGPRTILDLGTGPGTLLLAALDQWPDAIGLGVDGSEAALGFALRNAERLGLAGRAAFRRGDWADGIDERFDLILCNPPYVAEGAELGPGVREFEPDEALFAGASGLDAYKALGPQLPRLLNPGGLAAIEIGHDQAQAVTALTARDGLRAKIAEDLAARPRAVLLTWN
jgi:release factor glutamine methyltransferase